MTPEPARAQSDPPHAFWRDGLLAVALAALYAVALDRISDASPWLSVAGIGVGLLALAFTQYARKWSGIPLWFFLGGIALGMIVQPSIPDRSDLGDLLATSAQVIAGLLVALVVEPVPDRASDRDRQLRWLGTVALVVATLAAFAGLLPAVDGDADLICLWLVCGGILAAVATIVTRLPSPP
ncbi:hypothetical protein OM076_18300 [Solirubrobacter ginsenosidimutans]|uniref:Uncharacterized protein n=1 Tax=Solirubrobacter ginsenosidimutans TaxID=490573 RepID=A0A9X3MVY7_9ACTN|nr:hypothetical protein [Solirubrobacter ginsenosidimutans]MDA0162230.1 hypothetical protein [Solirubrobacter ginsenosidimutans]